MKINQTISCFISSCDSEYQAIFYTYYLMYCDFSQNFKNLLSAQKLCSTLTYTDDNLKAIYHHHSYSCFVRFSQFTPAIEHYNKAKKLYTKTNNLKKLSILKIKYSHYLLTVGLVEEAIKNDLATLNELVEKQYRLKNIGVLYNNIAWGYYLLKKYDQAIEYYLKSIQYFPDNETHFCLAYSYYKLDDLENAMKIIQNGKHSKNSSTYYYDFLDWLESFINRPYNKKAASILLKILEKYNDELTNDSRKFIYSELVNYYQYDKDFQNAFYYSHLLLENNSIGPVEFLNFTNHTH